MNIDTLTQKFQQKAEKQLSELKAKNSEGGNFDLTLIDEFLAFARKPQIQIAVVGGVKAGKSSLLNALFGSEVASVNVIPETACLSIFKASPQNQFKATFYSEAEWNELWESIKKSGDSTFSKKYDELNADRAKGQCVGRAPIERSFSDLEQLKKELERYTSAQYADHMFVKELEIGLAKYPLNKDIFFVDTPGLDDVVEYRSNITKDYMRRSNAVVVCVTASETLRNNDYLTIIKAHDSLNDEAEKLLVAGTKIDQLKNDGDWDMQKREWEKYFEGKNIKHIVGVSSRIHSFCKNLEGGKTFDEDALFDALTEINQFMRWRRNPDREIVKEKAGEIYEKANVGRILEILKNGPLKNPLQEQEREIKRLYNNLCSHYLSEIGRKKSTANEELELMDKSLEDQQAKIAELDVQRKKIEEGNALMHKFMSECKAKVEQMHENGKAELRKKIKA